MAEAISLLLGRGSITVVIGVDTPVLERVAERRMQHLSAAFEELGMAPERARHQARLTYSVYLGFLQLQRQHQTPSLSSGDFEAYIEHVIQTLIPA